MKILQLISRSLHKDSRLSSPDTEVNITEMQLVGGGEVK